MNAIFDALVDEIVTQVTAFTPILGVGLASVAAVGLVIGLALWGFPKVVGLFKRTAS